MLMVGVTQLLLRRMEVLNMCDAQVRTLACDAHAHQHAHAGSPRTLFASQY